jgi:hypothetical protein
MGQDNLNWILVYESVFDLIAYQMTSADMWIVVLQEASVLVAETTPRIMAFFFPGYTDHSREKALTTHTGVIAHL